MTVNIRLFKHFIHTYTEIATQAVGFQEDNRPSRMIYQAARYCKSNQMQRGMDFILKTGSS